MAEWSEADTERRERRDARQDVDLLADAASEAVTEFHRLIVAMSAANTSLINGTIHVLSDVLLGATRSSRPARERRRDSPIEEVATRGVTGMAGRLSRAMVEETRLMHEAAEQFAKHYEPDQAGDTRYEDKTVEELREIAREREIPGRTEMNKGELIRALREANRATAREAP